MATVCFAAMNTSVKFLSATLPTVELIWVRMVSHLIFVTLLFAPRYGWRLLATRKPGLQLLRSLCQLLSTACFFTAVSKVPLADTVAISYMAPLIVAALAGPALGERVTLGHWVSITVGFLGALLVIRPTGQETSPFAFLALGSAFLYGNYQLLTRRVGAVDRPETSVTYSAMLGAVALAAVVPFVWQAPAQPSHWLILGSLGLSGGLGHYFVARAFLWGPASVISPFHYIQLVWVGVAGYLVFGEVPSVWTLVGASIIVASGLNIAWRETR